MNISLAVLFTGILLFLGIISSKFSAKLGMPVLVFFLGIGMLAGSEGIGGVAFEDYALANSIGSVALALILFDGGLRTSLSSVRDGWKTALVLSTVGVLLTSLLTGLAAVWILQVPLLVGLLLGGIVGSTDAAAVFSVLRTSGLALPQKLTAALEVESGSNDPMAVFLTLGLVAVVTGTAASPLGLLWLFVNQFGVGALVGLGVGWLAVQIVNRINLNHGGLHPILMLSFGLVTFGLTAVLGGSGFLAVYVAGIVIGNSPIIYKRGTFLFHDAIAWLSQIILFVMLGLLSFPSRLVAIASSGFLIALVLILVARPLSVLISAVWFRFRLSELTFLSWAGLKGAVPITLATFPLMAGIEGSERLFDAVFFVVLVSAIAQGWSLPLVARWLKLGEPAYSPPLSIEINSLRRVNGDIIDYTVAPTARIVGHKLRALALPIGMVITLIVRDKEVIVPRGSTIIQPSDHVFVALRSELKPFVDGLFLSEAGPTTLLTGMQIHFHLYDTTEQIRWFFNLPPPEWNDDPLSALLDQPQQTPEPQLGPFLVMPGEEPDSVLLEVA